jgi:hypothetical protein
VVVASENGSHSYNHNGGWAGWLGSFGLYYGQSQAASYQAKWLYRPGGKSAMLENEKDVPRLHSENFALLIGFFQAGFFYE